MFVEQGAYQSLEIAKTLSLISKLCRSELGVMAARETEPASDMAELKKRHELYSSVEAYREKKANFPGRAALLRYHPFLPKPTKQA